MRGRAVHGVQNVAPAMVRTDPQRGSVTGRGSAKDRTTGVPIRRDASPGRSSTTGSAAHRGGRIRSRAATGAHPARGKGDTDMNRLVTIALAAITVVLIGS